MTSSLALAGNKLISPSVPYVLAVASHKGGTGRTTAALALSWCWGQTGLKIRLVDANFVPAASLIAANGKAPCPWEGVSLSAELPQADDVSFPADVVLVDCPSLTEKGAQAVLARATGVLLTTQAELLALRTTPAATRAVAAAHTLNPSLDLVGMVLPMFDAKDELQNTMLEQMRSLHSELLLEPPIPMRSELRDWPLRPGSALPSGPGRQAYVKLASILAGRLGLSRKS